MDEPTPIDGTTQWDRFNRIFMLDSKKTPVVDGYQPYTVEVAYETNVYFRTSEHLSTGFMRTEHEHRLTVTLRHIPEAFTRRRGLPEKQTVWYFEHNELRDLASEIGDMPRWVYELVKRARATFPPPPTEPA